MKPLLIAVSAAALAALAACGTQTAADTTLAPLQLTDAGATAPAAAAAAGGDYGFDLRTTLPTATPAPAAVWRLPRTSSADAARVAAALGIAHTPAAVHGGWVSRYAGNRLGVRADGSWTWGMDCSPNVPVQQDSLDAMCATASAGGIAVAPAPGRPQTTPALPPPAPGPDAVRARALAAPILGRLGWGGATVDVAVGSPTTSVIARRTVDGLATADWTTALTFDAAGTLTDASGWVGAPTRGRAYPLISADRAYRMLLAVPREMPMICAVRKDRKPGCAPIPPTVITAATLGLALRHDLGRPLLVPAWLFSVKGSDEPLVTVAVDPRWVKPPAIAVPRPLPAQTIPPQTVNPAGPAVKPS